MHHSDIQIKHFMYREHVKGQTYYLILDINKLSIDKEFQICFSNLWSILMKLQNFVGFRHQH